MEGITQYAREFYLKQGFHEIERRAASNCNFIKDDVEVAVVLTYDSRSGGFLEGTVHQFSAKVEAVQ